MSGKPESALAELYARLPGPDPDAADRALARALDALPDPPRRTETPVRAIALLLAAVAGLLAVAAGALAAAGALHVSFGAKATYRPRTQLILPAGAGGIAVTVDGRLWVATAGGFRLQGLPVSAAALSPHALYVAVGVGDALVVMAPDGRRAWSQATSGPVAEIAWAPDGLRIAYVVDEHGRFRLRMIEGNGRRSRLVDPAVRPVRPSWRADSLALAYVAAGGRAVVFDLGHEAHRVAAGPVGAAFVAFAPRGSALAIATRHSVAVGRRTVHFGAIAGLGWADRHVAVAAGSAVYLLGAERLTAPAPIDALDANGGRVTIATADTVLAGSPGGPLVPVLRLPPGSRVASVTTR